MRSPSRRPVRFWRAEESRDCRTARFSSESVGLPTTYDGDWTRLLAAMRIDKKARADRLRFVVLDALAKPRILDDPDPSLVAAAFSTIAKGDDGKVFL